MTAPVGFIGLGQMGGRMARRLLARGHSLVVCDISPRALAPFREMGVPVAGSPSEVAARCQVVLASLPTPASVAEVVLGPGGLAEAMGPGSLFVDLSTTGVEVEERVARALEAKGAGCLDAPVSGGVRGADEGTLSIMAAGSREALERARPLLEVIGRHIFHVSERPGHGQAMKLINNLLSATAMAATAEAMVLAAKVGLDPETALSVLNVSSGRNTATEDKFPRSVLPRTFDYGFRAGLMHKDVALAAALARQAGVPLVVGRAVELAWEMAVREGLAEQDFTALVTLYERWAGAVVGGREAR
ncbi:2-(hydroxymethyl)glutarate dehydrogenase [bacterium HR24]|nr:2-(hydroxymethyl)glutarate dehydrogenase [bacterium HR24]